MSTSLEQVVLALSYWNETALYASGVVCESLTDQDEARTTSIMDENCLVLGFSLSGSNSFYFLDSLLDAKEMGGKTVLFTSVPNKDSQAIRRLFL